MAPPADILAEPTCAARAGVDAACPRAASRDLRRKAILDIARDIFLEQGFAATSMSAVAARVGGSKGTLYNYFSSKEELFSAMVAEECGEEFLAMTDFRPTEGVEEALRRFGVRFLRYVLSDAALGFHRLLSAEAPRFPDLGRMFYDAGPARTVERLSAFLGERMALGQLRQADPEAAAAFLTGLLKSSLHHRRVWNLDGPPTERALQAHVAQAVEVFLHGFAILA
jgi:AcrR family transcriptional regulator